jgi:hypothetical protein
MRVQPGSLTRTSVVVHAHAIKDAPLPECRVLVAAHGDNQPERRGGDLPLVIACRVVAASCGRHAREPGGNVGAPCSACTGL